MKKFISILMVIVMLASMIPFGAFAEEPAAEQPKEETSVSEIITQPLPEEKKEEQLSLLPEPEKKEEPQETLVPEGVAEKSEGEPEKTVEEPVKTEEVTENTGEEPGTTEETDPEKTGEEPASGEKSEEMKDKEPADPEATPADPENTNPEEAADAEKTEETQDPEKKEEPKEEPKAPVPTWDVNVGYKIGNTGMWNDWTTVKVPQDTGIIPDPRAPFVSTPLAGYHIVAWYFKDSNVPVVFGETVLTEALYNLYNTIFAVLEEDVETFTVTLDYGKEDLENEKISSVPEGYVFNDDEESLKTFENGTVEETDEEGNVTVSKFVGWEYDQSEIKEDTTLSAKWEIVEVKEAEAETEITDTEEIKEIEPQVEEDNAEENEEAEPEAEAGSPEETDGITYSIKEEETDEEWVKGSGEGLSLASEADLEDFVALYIDGVEVSREFFTLTVGSTVATVDENFLETLTEGEHTFEIRSKDGSAVSTFKVTSLKDPHDPTVTFHMNGHGGADKTDPAPGGKVTKPEDPTEDGLKFAGWFKDEALTDAFNFETETVSGSFDLYAKWVATVTFDMNGHGGNITKDVKPGDRVERPDNPTADGYRLSAWYCQEALETEFDFETEIVENTTLFAKWIPVFSVKIDYDLEGGSGYTNEGYTVDCDSHSILTVKNNIPINKKVIIEASIPISPSVTATTTYLFKGWEVVKGKDAGTILNDISQYGEIEENIEIKAIWKALRQVKFSVISSKYKDMLVATPVNGVLNKEGNSINNIIKHNDIFYVYEGEEFSINLELTNKEDTKLIIESIKYDGTKPVNETKITDVQKGSTNPLPMQYTVNLDDGSPDKPVYTIKCIRSDTKAVLLEDNAVKADTVFMNIEKRFSPLIGEGKKISGWFWDEELTNPVKWETITISISGEQETGEGIKIEGNTTLYAKIEEVPETFTVTFNYFDNPGVYKTEEGKILPQTDNDTDIPYNGTAVDPEGLVLQKTIVTYTDKDGNELKYRFLGWDSPLIGITEDKTVKAIWGAASPNVLIDYGPVNGKIDAHPEYKNYSYAVKAGGTTEPLPVSPAIGEIVSYTTISGTDVTNLKSTTMTYKFLGWEITKGSGAGKKLGPGESYGEIWDNTTITAQWRRLRPVTYKVSPSKYSAVAKGSPLSGVYLEDGKTLMTGTLSHGDTFYVYENEPFSIYSGVGNGVYVGLYIKTIRYGDDTAVLMAEYLDVRTGGSSSSYTVNIAQTKAAFTGDDFNPGLWLTLAFVSLAGAAWTLKKRTRKRAK